MRYIKKIVDECRAKAHGFVALLGSGIRSTFLGEYSCLRVGSGVEFTGFLVSGVREMLLLLSFAVIFFMDCSCYY